MTGLDIPFDLKVRWRMCRNCDHTEVNHRMDGTRCYVRKGGDCQCSRYESWTHDSEVRDDRT